MAQVLQKTVRHYLAKPKEPTPRDLAESHSWVYILEKVLSRMLIAASFLASIELEMAQVLIGRRRGK